MWRNQPRTAEVRRLVAEGLIGDLRLIRSSFSFPIDPNDWRLASSRGGGAIWDVGCYGVNTARLFAGGEPTEMHAFQRLGPTGVDLTFTAERAFAKGVIAQIDCSFEQPFRCAYELVGTQGSIEVPDAYLPPKRPLASLRTERGVRELSFDAGNQYAAMVDAFAEAIARKRLTDPAESGLEQMRVLEFLKEAAHRV